MGYTFFFNVKGINQIYISNANQQAIQLFINRLKTQQCEADIAWFESCMTNLEQDTLLFIYEDDFPVGYLKILSIPSYPYFPSCTAEIHALYILPYKRNHGYGSQLIKRAEDHSRENGYSHIGLGVGITKDYQKALSLYIGCGYKPDGLGLYHQPLKDNFADYGDTITIDNSTTLWFIKPLK